MHRYTLALLGGLALALTACTTTIRATYRDRVHVSVLRDAAQRPELAPAVEGFNDGYRTCGARRASVVDYANRATSRRDGFTVATLILTALGTASTAVFVPIASWLTGSMDAADREIGVVLSILNGSLTGVLGAVITALTTANAIDSGGLGDAGPALASIDNSLARAWQSASSGVALTDVTEARTVLLRADGSLREPTSCNPTIGGRGIPEPTTSSGSDDVEQPAAPPTLPAL